jgi:hypothetical protein
MRTSPVVSILAGAAASEPAITVEAAFSQIYLAA